VRVWKERKKWVVASGYRTKRELNYKTPSDRIEHYRTLIEDAYGLEAAERIFENRRCKNESV